MTSLYKVGDWIEWHTSVYGLHGVNQITKINTQTDTHKAYINNALVKYVYFPEIVRRLTLDELAFFILTEER